MTELVVIMRYPVLMEDEGQFTKEEAENWIKLQINEYFKPSDYYITKANG